MKKKITLLFISFFVLVSCSSDADSLVIPESPTATHALLNAGSVDITWSGVEGAGITYNVYRNDSPLKINSVPLTEAKFTDVLKTTGAFTYTITANLKGVESAKGVVSEKVVLELPKTRTVELIDKFYNTKYEYAYTYDTSNIAKLVTQTTKATITNLKNQAVTITNTIAKYTYSGDLITKITYYNNDNILKSSLEYDYNEQKKLIAEIRKKSDESVNYTVNYTYNEDGTTTETSDLSGWGTWVYTLSMGNLVKYTYSTPQGDIEHVEVSNSVFDTKNEYTQNIFGFNFIKVSGSVNNELSSSIIVTEDGNEVASAFRSSKSEYTYNENDYVLTKMKSIMTPSNETIKTEKTVITYY